MPSNNQTVSNLFYTKAVKSSKRGLHNVSGRYKNDTKLEKYIFEDIIIKLKLDRRELSLLDVGCGCGNLVKYMAKYSDQKKINVTLCDIKPVILELKKKYKSKRIKFLDNEFIKINFKQKYDRILIYSALQCMNDVKKNIQKAYSLLKKGGILLIGDLPNIDRKFRFQSSGLNKNYKHFLKNTKQNLNINDKLLFWVLKNFRNNKSEVFLLNQPSKLPFSKTREDILFIKYNY
jgi:ubiquinone/menaquinone biosynthesis C-methylase UbiE